MAAVFKEGNESSIDCYKPVLLPSSISKVFEKPMFDTIYSKVCHTFHEIIFGFRRKGSAFHQLFAFLKKKFMSTMATPKSKN